MPDKLQLRGKRKRRDQFLNSDSDRGSVSDKEHSNKLQNFFRKHFEASFKPLNSIRQSPCNHERVELQQTQVEDESDWEGISDADQVEASVTQHQSSQILKPVIPHDEYKIFMVSPVFSLYGIERLI